MGMSISTAEAIVKIVGNDPEAKKRIASYIDDVMPDSWGLSGSFRNIGYVLGNMASFGSWGDPTETEFADRVCTGISDAGANAINRAIQNKDPRLRNVKRAVPVHRTNLGTAHTATGLIMVDGTEHVMDWHATLNAANPMMYRHLRDWKSDKGGIIYEDFAGWK